MVPSSSIRSIIIGFTIQEWFKQVGGAGIVLPTGWLGRPYDNVYFLKEVNSSNETLELLFIPSIRIRFPNPPIIQISNTELAIEFSEMHFYREGDDSKHSQEKFFSNGSVKFVAS